MENRDLELEAKIYELCSPYIARKIILELCRAQNNQYLVQQKTQDIYDVILKGKKDLATKQRVVNLDLLTCTCLRKNYFGFCCSHIFSVLLKNNENIKSFLPKLILDRWKICQQSQSSSLVKESTILQMKIFKTPSRKRFKKIIKKFHLLPVKI